MIYAQKKENTQPINNKKSKQYKNLKSQNKMLQKQVSGLGNLNLDDQANIEESKHNGKLLCLRIEDVPIRNTVSGEDVLDSIKKLSEVVEPDVPGVVLNQAQMTGRF